LGLDVENLVREVKLNQGQVSFIADHLPLLIAIAMRQKWAIDLGVDVDSIEGDSQVQRLIVLGRAKDLFEFYDSVFAPQPHK
jgi:hypothetical protein